MRKRLLLNRACYAPCLSLVILLLVSLTASAHRVEYYTSSGCATGQNVTIDAKITNAPAVTWYNWQYKDATGVWKCFVNGSNTINGIAFTVSGALAQNVSNDAPLLTIQAATTALEDVQVRVLMRESASPCGAPAGTTWGGDDLALNEVKVFRIHVYAASANCGATTPGCIGNLLTDANGYYGGFENKVFDEATATFTDNNFIAGAGTTGYTAGGTTSAIPPTSGSGTYQVWNNPYSMNTGNARFAPHSGNYQMIIQGTANTARKAWYKTVTVTPGATYNLCAWVARTQGSNAFNLQLTVNNVQVANSAVSATIGQWTQVCGSYTIPYGVTQVEISIRDVATAAERFFSIDDICFTQTANPVNLGNVVWLDANDNGIKDAGEQGLDGVKVVLYADNDNNGVADGTAIASTTTTGGGVYAFNGVAPGSYFIQLENYPGTDYYVSHIYGGDPDNNIDNDNNGVSQAAGNVGIIKGGTITLQPGTEPTADGDGSNGNLTYDVGIYKGNGLGDFVWVDNNQNGVQDTGEPGLAGVTVNLVNSANNAVVATTTSNASGFYFFNDFDASLTYKLVFTTPANYLPTLANTVLNGGNDNNDSDPVGGVISGISIPYGQWNHSYDAGFYKPVISISGNVFDDRNGLIGTPANTVDGAGTNAGGLNAVLIDAATGKVVASVAVPASGVYSFTGLNMGNYSVLITTNTATVGANPPVAALPANWVNIGENLGAGAGNDGTVNGLLPIGNITASVTNANFGIEQLPTAYDGTLNTQANPGGIIQVNVPSSYFRGTDPEDEDQISQLHFTAFPDNATSIVINGVKYMNTATPPAGFVSWPAAGVTVPAGATVTVDPIDGAVVVVIPYRVIDQAGKESPNTAKVNVPFATPTPDLTPRITLNPNNIIGTSTMQVTVQLNEIAKSPTNGGVITMYVDKLAQFSNFAFNAAATTNSAGQSVQNSLFTIDAVSSPDFYIITTNVVLNNAARRVMFSVTVTPGSSAGTTPVSVILANGSGGETVFTNNRDFTNLSYSFIH